MGISHHLCEVGLREEWAEGLSQTLRVEIIVPLLQSLNSLFPALPLGSVPPLH